MDLYRKVENNLENWLKEKYALLVYGARQVGKTYTIKHFLEKHNIEYIYLNFHENIQAIKIIIKAENVKDFFQRLEVLCGNTIINENTYIFIDEIQEYYTYIEKNKDIEEYFDIIGQSKFIVSETNNRLIMSGSLLRLELNNLITNPVGYVLPMEMYPLDFEEFLLANKVNPKLIEIAKECFVKQEEVPDYIHNSFMNLFKKYLLVGGMPQAVSVFIDTNSLVSVDNAHRTIDHYIREDITKYAEDNEKLKIQEIYDLIPTELSNLSRRFVINDIPSHKRGINEQLSFSWLNKAGITIPVYCARDLKIPLKINSSRSLLKLFHEDTGILTYLLFDLETKLMLLNDELTINYGQIYENAVAQNLYCHEFSDIYYYNSKKHGEIDFVLENRGEIIPIEVKSGKNYYIHRALNNVMNIKDYNIKKAYVLCNNNVSEEGNIVYLPIYMIMFFHNKMIVPRN